MNRSLKIAYSITAASFLFLFGTGETGCQTIQNKPVEDVTESRKPSDNSISRMKDIKVVAIVVTPPRLWEGAKGDSLVKDVEQTLIEELDAKNWDLVSTSKVNKILEELRRQNGDLTDPETIQRAGRQLNASHLLIADVSRLHFEKKRSTGGIVEGFLGGGKTQFVEAYDYAARGRLNMQLVSVETARPLFPVSKEIKKDCKLEIDIFEEIGKAARELAKSFPKMSSSPENKGDGASGSNSAK